MTKRQRMLLLVVALLLVLGVASYGVISLTTKLNQAKELNEQLAEAEDSEGQQEPEISLVVDDKEGQSGEEIAAHDSEEKPQSSETSTGQAGVDPAASPDDNAGQPSPTNSVEASNPSSPSTAPAPTPIDKKERKKQIDSTITASMEALRGTCKATSSQLIAQIKVEITSDKDAALESIQTKYLGKVVAAEAECDAQFNQLISDAKAKYEEAGLQQSELPDWGSEYESAKANARSEALVELASALQ
ncbi:hypothetical protein RB620_14640 [Paenibacillus sp. LHD-117]|uniref:hypothetical protein n=1 Tax=Paenibacillus sp. LHD-117 TaxID=3071412 RepID=UPI0027DF3708|nr:hypothetical protein [Paenibacillus sp. LHD-117]MDQ6420665.1 hypothetical protein [Paenibacillus sp. LHD-117]